MKHFFLIVQYAYGPTHSVVVMLGDDFESSWMDESVCERMVMASCSVSEVCDHWVDSWSCV